VLFFLENKNVDFFSICLKYIFNLHCIKLLILVHFIKLYEDISKSIELRRGKSEVYPFLTELDTLLS